MVNNSGIKFDYTAEIKRTNERIEEYYNTLKSIKEPMKRIPFYKTIRCLVDFKVMLQRIRAGLHPEGRIE